MRKFFLLTISVLIILSSPLSADKISTYLEGTYLSVDEVSNKLKENGFEVVATHKVNKKSTGTTIVFTNRMIKKAASKKSRGFAGVLRALIDSERNLISVTNPIYLQKAFLQDDYNEQNAKKILSSLESVFGSLKSSLDSLDSDDIAGYHFMMGMPYYEDSIVIGEGDMAELLQKVTGFAKGRNYVYDIKLSESSYLVGCHLGRKTSKFVKKIGTQNAQLLPYMILIENNEARILSPKYYIAINYPSLSMGDFMKISTIPGAIEKDLKKPFR